MSPQRLPRRKRLVLLTAGWGAVFMAAVALVVWWVARPEPGYRPGEAIEGLTAELARTLPPDYPRVTFTEVTDESGIAFRHFAGHRSTQLPEDYGSGAAWGDYDNDGRLDLFVVNDAGPLALSDEEIAASPAHAALYHNDGNGSFTDVSAAAGVDYRGHGMATAWADYDNDGWLDLFVSTYGENVLFHNNGDGTFRDVSHTAGVAGPQGFWAGASWADYDRDGWVDLYVTGYVKYTRPEGRSTARQYDVEVPASLNPSAFEPERNLLYHNNGDGSFEEVAADLGVAGDAGRSLGAAWCDLDNDGWPDLYVANDVSDNVLFRNLGDGRFEDISHAAWVADYRGAMGLAIGDWDGDADTDMFVTHWIAQENALYSNLRTQFLSLDAPPSNVRFTDEADRFGLGQVALDFIGWGTSFFDYDGDGALDLLVVNGSTFQDDEQPHLLVPMRDQLFWNRGKDDGFYDVSAVSGQYFQREYVGRGAAFGDYDNDGDVDVFIVNNGGPGILLRNDNATGNRWLKVQLEGRQSNRAAIGARLRLVTGGAVQLREVGVQSPYLSNNSLVQHFGVGTTGSVDSLVIHWPSGSQNVFLDLPTNQTVHVVEGLNDPQ